VQDYDEKYPNGQNASTTAGPGGSWGTTRWYWPQLLYPYTKSWQVYFCPSGEGGAQPEDSKVKNYGINSLMLRERWYSGISLAAVDAPANTYMVMDAGAWRMMPN